MSALDIKQIAEKIMSSRGGEADERSRFDKKDFSPRHPAGLEMTGKLLRRDA